MVETIPIPAWYFTDVFPRLRGNEIKILLFLFSQTTGRGRDRCSIGFRALARKSGAREAYPAVVSLRERGIISVTHGACDRSVYTITGASTVNNPQAKKSKAKTGAIPAKRQHIGSACDWTCTYCGARGTEKRGPDNRVWHVDHLYAKGNGGDSEPDNLVLACATCNLKKSKELVSEIFKSR